MKRRAMFRIKERKDRALVFVFEHPDFFFVFGNFKL